MLPIRPVLALDVLDISGSENGLRQGRHFEIWHDPSGAKILEDAEQALRSGQFEALRTKGSTGLKAGAYWSHFSLRNISEKELPVHLEYVDHQLIYLTAYQRADGSEGFDNIADFALDDPFSARIIAHQRFVVPVTLAPGETVEFLIRYGSDGRGFVFPDLRVWSPENLRYAQTSESVLVAFLVGGLALMATLALGAGLATGESLFFAYFVYALAKIAVWPTVMGFTHQFVLRDNFHWSFISLSGALSIFTGIWFARAFLQTRRNIPRFDYVLLLMLLNASLLVVFALTRQTALSVIVITLALLLYPAMAIAGFLRWRQGAKEAAVFTVAWSFLMAGLFVQALRDLGLVEHNFVNYYWPAVASYTEMAVILAAMGMRIGDLRRQKEEAVQLHTQNLERSKTELEATVKKRTKDLEVAKAIAELEARTDSLTGINNRRSFLLQATVMFERSESHNDDFVILMFDIDHFKQINDRHGHGVGDLALIAFTKAITAQIRDVDVFGRLGGEEFALALNGSFEMAANTAERLREAISQIRIDTDDGIVQFTTSIGGAAREAKGSIDQLIKRADTALYEAKEGGRNRLVFDFMDKDFEERRHSPA